jgi:CcmD family protein
MSFKRSGMGNRKNSTLLKSLSTWLLAALLLLSPCVGAAANGGNPNFQVRITDSLGRPLRSATVDLLVDLTMGDLNGQPQYQEQQVLLTDSLGVATMAIGYGQPTDPKYVFDNFNLDQGDNFIRISRKQGDDWQLILNAQMPNVPKIKKWLFADEKNNTVIAVMIIVWLGIVVYLLLSSGKLKKLEKQVAALKQQRGA